jgi:predicted amidohydrolase YtcJ
LHRVNLWYFCYILEPRYRSHFVITATRFLIALASFWSVDVLADTALYNVVGYIPTADGVRDFTVLVFDDDGKVVAIGDEALLADVANADRIDGDGKFVLPGLTDAHAHVYSQGFLTVSLNLLGAESVEAAVARIDEFAVARRTGWILGRGWNQVLWPVQEFPTAADIDSVLADRPVWLRRIDGHAGWANSKALAIAGIDEDTPDPVGGKIIRDDNGKATGVLIDNAMALVEKHVPDPTRREIREAYASAIDSLLALGITGVHDAGISKTEAEVYMSMADDGDLGMRIYAMLSDTGANLDAFDEPIRAYGNDHLDIASVKLYSDGALGSRGAAMIEPYDDDPENRGLPFYTQEELDSLVRKANAKGFQVGIHAIGDLGNRMSLDAFERAQGGKASPLRNRVEHAQIIALDDIPRFAELGVIASMQPVHATSDMNMAEDRVGPQRIKGGYAWRRLLGLAPVARFRRRARSRLGFPGRTAQPVPRPVRSRRAAGPAGPAGGRLVFGPVDDPRRSAAFIYARCRLRGAPGEPLRQSRTRQVG